MELLVRKYDIMAVFTAREQGLEVQVISKSLLRAETPSY